MRKLLIALAVVTIIVIITIVVAAVITKKRKDERARELEKSIAESKAKKEALNLQLIALQKQLTEVQALQAGYITSGDNTAATLTQASIDKLTIQLSALYTDRASVNSTIISDTTNLTNFTNEQITLIQSDLVTADEKKAAALREELARLQQLAIDLQAEMQKAQQEIKDPTVTEPAKPLPCRTDCIGGSLATDCTCVCPTDFQYINGRCLPKATTNPNPAPCPIQCSPDQTQKADCSCECTVACPTGMIQNTDCSCRCPIGTSYVNGACKVAVTTTPRCPNVCAADQVQSTDCSCVCQTQCPPTMLQSIDCSCSCPTGTYLNGTVCYKPESPTQCTVGCLASQTQLADCSCICTTPCPTGLVQNPDCSCSCPASTVYNASTKTCILSTPTPTCGTNEILNSNNTACVCAPGYTRDSSGQCVLSQTQPTCEPGWIGPTCTTKDPTVYPVESVPGLVPFLCDNRVVYGGGADSQSPNMGTTQDPWYFNIYYSPVVDKWFGPNLGWFTYDRSKSSTYPYCIAYAR